MARALVELSAGSRIPDYISLGVVAKRFPRSTVDRVLARSGQASRRQRDLPAHVVVDYVIALALYMQVSCREVLRCLLEGLAWLQGPDKRCRVAGSSGISQARTRLGAEPLERLHDEVVRPLATRKTKGAWYRRWRLVSLDGSNLDMADEERNREAFGRPGASRGAKIVLRSKTPELVRQEFYGLLMAHFAIRGLMHEAALEAEEAPNRLSYVHAVRVIRRKLPQAAAIPPRVKKAFHRAVLREILRRTGRVEPWPTQTKRREA